MKRIFILLVGVLLLASCNPEPLTSEHNGLIMADYKLPIFGGGYVLKLVNPITYEITKIRTFYAYHNKYSWNDTIQEGTLKSRRLTPYADTDGMVYFMVRGVSDGIVTGVPITYRGAVHLSTPPKTEYNNEYKTYRRLTDGVGVVHARFGVSNQQFVQVTDDTGHIRFEDGLVTKFNYETGKTDTVKIAQLKISTY